MSLRPVLRGILRPVMRSPNARASAARAVYPLDDVGGVAPAFAYGARKLSSSYAGSALRVVRTSDSVEQDIGFSGSYLDFAALDAFLGVTAGRVVTFYNQTGSGFNATQATAADRYYITKVTGRSGWHVVGLASTANLSASIVMDSRAFNVFSVLEAMRPTFTAVFQLGTSTNRVTTYETTATPINKYSGDFGTASYVQAKRCILETEGSVSRTLFTQDSEQTLGSAAASLVLTGGFLGDTDIVGGFKQYGYFEAIIGYGRVLSAGEKTTIKSALQALYRVNITPTRRVIFDGDSITVGGDVPTSLLFNSFPRQVTTGLPGDAAVYNIGNGGAHILDKAANYSTTARQLISGFVGTRVLCLHIGTNDLTVGARTAAQIYADIQTYVAAARADGAKVVVSTLLPNSAWTAPQQTTRNDLNTLIVNGWATFADGLANFAADPTMGPQAAASNSTLYMDGLHPTQLGHSYLAPIAAAAISALL